VLDGNEAERGEVFLSAKAPLTGRGFFHAGPPASYDLSKHDCSCV
jgi:hypothetical protein